MAGIDEFDELDLKIVETLCISSQGSFRQIAKQLNIHPTTLIQRVKTLESKGVIGGYRAKINYMNLGFDYIGMVQIIAGDVHQIQEKVVKIPQVMAVYDVTGDVDCIVFISCLNREEFSNVVKQINAIPGVKKTSTSVILDVVKNADDFVPILSKE
jgi:DNA-binding Lrp family transcriptional regulator